MVNAAARIRNTAKFPVAPKVMLNVTDREAAKAWYHRPEYQERAALRQRAAPYRGLMVEGF